MLSLALLLAFELHLYLQASVSLPAVVQGGFAVVLLMAFGWTASHDVGAGTLNRLGFTLAIVLYYGSIARWLPIMDALYMDAPTAMGEVLAAAFLLVAPIAFLMAPAARSLPDRYPR